MIQFKWFSRLLLAISLSSLVLTACTNTPTEVPGTSSATRDIPPTNTIEVNIEPTEAPTVLPTEMEIPSPTADEVIIPPGEAPATPIVVMLSMNKAPKVGEEAEVTLLVQAYEDAPGTTAQIELPQGAQLLWGESTWEGDVLVDSPVQLRIGILFTEEGEYRIQGRALRQVNNNMTWGDLDDIFLTVKTDAGFFGYESGGDTTMQGVPLGENGGADETIPESLMVEMNMNKAPKVGEEAEVTLQVQANEGGPETFIQIVLPEGAELVWGEPSWAGFLEPGISVQLTIGILFTQEGDYTIWGTARQEQENETIFGEDKYIYLTVLTDSGFFRSGPDEE